MASGGIIALDLSQRTGWAYGLAGASPRAGVWQLPAYIIDAGRCLAALENQLLDAFTVHQPKQLVVEAPLPPSASRNAIAAQQAYEMNGVIRAACYRWDVALAFHHLATVRKAVLGRGNGIEKRDVIAWCQGQGWDITDDNAADAAVLWVFACRLTLARRAA